MGKLPAASEQQVFIERLCPQLRLLLDAELAAGNRVVDAGPGLRDWNAVLVRLAEPFQTPRASAPVGLVYRQINDPHWWLAEYEHLESGHLLACGFRGGPGGQLAKP